MIATVNHYYLDSLRGAPPPKGAARKAPLKGLAGVAVLDGVQPFHAKLRTAHIREPEGFPAVRRIPIGMHQGEFVQPKPPSAPERGAAAAAAEGCGEQLPFCQGLGEFVQALAAPFGGSAAKRQRGCRW